MLLLCKQTAQSSALSLSPTLSAPYLSLHYSIPACALCLNLFVKLFENLFCISTFIFGKQLIPKIT